MITLKSPIRIAVSALVLIGSTSLFAGEPPSFPLTCNGSTGFSVTFNKNFNELNIRFHGSEVGGTTRGPRPGECAWDDRGWRKGEPNVLFWRVPHSDTALWFGTNAQILVASSTNKGFQTLLSALKNNGMFRVMVHRVGTGKNAYMKITRLENFH